MAASRDNPWWVDVLENGPSSPNAKFFHIDWKPVGGIIENQTVLLILGNPYHDVLESREPVVTLDDFGDNFGLNMRYYEYHLPQEVNSYGFILSQAVSCCSGSATDCNIGRPVETG